MNDLHIWLAGSEYPITGAVYYERVLRTICRTTTMGPALSPELFQKLHERYNMYLPPHRLDVYTSPSPDMREIINATAPADYPSLYLWIETGFDAYPRNLHTLPCPKICYVGDSHLNLKKHLEWAQHFDMVFIAQHEYLKDFCALGMDAHWLPFGCDPEIHRQFPDPQTHQIGFVGGIMPGSRREALLNRLNSQIPVHYERCYMEDMARVFSRSKIIFNEAVKNDMNMRVFEAMSTGSLLLTDIARNSNQEILFRDGEDYAIYRDNQICDVARFYMENDALREQIAARGQRLIRTAHTYRHRVEDLLAVAVGGKQDTFSAEELRDRSLATAAPIDAEVATANCISTARRSFIIPVLDMSPASEFNISTLLDDLKEIEGDVIVIFNGQEVAAQLCQHPRITRYAIMKQNIGVARAWNLGLEMAATPTIFIMNADLYVERPAIEALEQALWQLPNAACVGPQGSYVEFALCRDYIYFDKGIFDQPIEVDAVSGFFFALKLEHFDRKLLHFENGYTPCYFEEWDLGLQIKQAGLKSYVVPTTAYSHHWSGSIRAYREISFYDKAETAGQILLRNRRLFLNKWRGIADRDQNDQLLQSGFRNNVATIVTPLIAQGAYAEAQHYLDMADETEQTAALRRFLNIYQCKQDSNA